MYHLYFNLIIYRKILSFVIFVFGLKSRVYYISEVKRKNTSSGYFKIICTWRYIVMKTFKHRNIRKEFSNMISAALVIRTEDDIWDITRMRKDVKPVQMNRFYSLIKSVHKDHGLFRKLIMETISHDERITNDSLIMLIHDMIDIVDYLATHNGKAYLVKVLVHPQMVVRLIPVSTISEEELKASFWKAMDSTPIV